MLADAEEIRFIITAGIGGLGFVAGVAYLVLLKEGPEMPPALEKVVRDPAPWGKRTRRRRVGAALMAILGPMFCIGANWLDAQRGAASFVAFWGLFCGMLLWLCGLALLDLLQMHRWRRQLLIDSHLRMEDMLSQMRRAMTPGKGRKKNKQ